MTVWRATALGTISHPRDGMDIILSPERAYDDSDPYVKELVDRFPSMFTTDNPVIERATAEPGEKRRVKRAS